MPPKLLPRKLLIASIGVATINYVAVACGGGTVLTDSNKEGGADAPPTSANLPAPPPMDASTDGDAADGD